MLNDAAMIATWMDFNRAFNAGDYAACEAMLADDFTGTANALSFPDRAAFIAAAKAGRDTGGWIRQEVISAAAHGNVVIGHHRNVFADGTSREGGAAAMFDENGKICAVRALTSGGTAMRATS